MPVTQTNTSYATPRTWLPDDALVAADFNDEIRDKILALKTPANGHSEVNEASDYTTSSTSFGDVDATDMAITIITGGGDVEVSVVCSIINNTLTSRTYFDIYESVAGGRVGGDDGICESGTANTSAPQVVSFTYQIASLSAGSHTFKLQWKVSGGTTTMYAGAGTSGHDTHPQFKVREIS